MFIYKMFLSIISCWEGGEQVHSSAAGMTVYMFEGISVAVKEALPAAHRMGYEILPQHPSSHTSVRDRPQKSREYKLQPCSVTKANA